MTLLVVTARADRDVDHIYDHLKSVGGTSVALSYNRAIENFLARLADFPEIGSPRPSLGRWVRIGLIDPYLVVYRFDPRNDQVTILRVLHGRRDIARHLLPRPSSA